MPETAPEKLLSMREAAERLSVSYNTIYRMLREKAFRAYLVRGHWKVRQSDLEKYLDRQANRVA